MLRREAISILAGSAFASAATDRPLDRLLDPRLGAAILLDSASGHLIAANSSPILGRALLPPGSAIKPFVFEALIERRIISADENYVCPRRLVVSGREMSCSHPRMAAPLHIDEGLAYSCNCFVAHVAERFAPGELAAALESKGFGNVTSVQSQKLQALGEEGILATPMEMANAYRGLALRLTGPKGDSGSNKILTGLEGAVDFGTAQLARVPWARVAGKTGTTLHQGEPIAWFAGFAPSRAPQVIVTVMLSGRHAGSDAAPVAADVLKAWKTGLV